MDDMLEGVAGAKRTLFYDPGGALEWRRKNNTNKNFYIDLNHISKIQSYSPLKYNTYKVWLTYYSITMTYKPQISPNISKL